MTYKISSLSRRRETVFLPLISHVLMVYPTQVLIYQHLRFCNLLSLINKGIHLRYKLIIGYIRYVSYKPTSIPDDMSIS